MTRPVPGPLRTGSSGAPTLAAVRPQPPDKQPAMEPYRALFPLGVALAVAGVVPWLAASMGVGAWPGPLHAALMIQGFELCFVAGFLLTAMPAFTHGPRCRPAELAVVVAGISAFAILRAASLEAAAQWAFALVLAFVLVTLGRRVRPGAAAPPEEFALVGVGLLLGIAGGVWQALAASGLAGEPAPRFGLRLIERGMVLSIVLGLGGLLVPVFSGQPNPLVITGVARAGQRLPRRAFVAGLAALLLAALAAEARGQAQAGAALRALAAAASVLLAWKLWRLPRGSGRLAWSLWTAGTSVAAGLLAAALLPERDIACWHVVMIGGYGLLTLAIGTRVVVSHGGHGPADEPRVLHAGVLGALAVAAALRLPTDGSDPAALALYAGAAVAWSVAWSLWLAGAWPRVRRSRRPPLVAAPHR